MLLYPKHYSRQSWGLVVIISESPTRPRRLLSAQYSRCDVSLGWHLLGVTVISVPLIIGALPWRGALQGRDYCARPLGWVGVTGNCSRCNFWAIFSVLVT